MPPMLASSAKGTKYKIQWPTQQNKRMPPMASSAWAWLGFLWASSGLLLLGFFCFFFFWCFGVLLLLATGSTAGVRLATALPLLFTIFYGGGGLLLPGRADTVPGRRKSPDTSCAVQCRVAQGTGSLEHPCLAGVIPCCCPKRAHLIAARSATCGRWSGGCLIERRRQTL